MAKTTSTYRTTRRVGFLNPLYAYAVIWSVILVLYALGWSLIYAPLRPGLLFFFLATIVSSLVLGAALQKRLVQAATTEYDPGRWLSASKLITTLLVSGFLAEFVLAGHVPLLDFVLGTQFGYGDFPGIPVVHVIIVTLAIFYVAFLADQFTRARARRRVVLAIQFLMITGMFVLTLNRGALMLSVFMASMVFLSGVKLTLRRVLVTIVLVLVVMYGFGCIGNLRFGLPYWDNSYIISISRVSDRYPDWLPGQFLWTYMYLVSPLGNFNDIVAGVAPQNDFVAMFINMIPDFITKRLFPFFDPTTPLTVQYFNVSTGFASAWKFNGYAGIWTTYFVLLGLVALATRVVRNSLQVATWAVLAGVVSFMFFANALSYSGVSFALAYPVVGSLIRFQRRRPAAGTSAIPPGYRQIDGRSVGHPALEGGTPSRVPARSTDREHR